MITVGRILAAIRRQKDFQQGMLHKHLDNLISLGGIRDIETGRIPYIEPKILVIWLEWLELAPNECEYLVQENVRCLIYHQLSEIKALKVRPMLLRAMADTVALCVRGKPIDVTKITSTMTVQNLPHLLIRPPYIDTLVSAINNKE